MKFRTKMIILFTVTILFSMLIIGVRIFDYVYKIVLDDRSKSLSENVNLVDVNINEEVKEIDILTDAVISFNEDRIKNKNYDEFALFLEKYIQVFNKMYNVYIINNGEIEYKFFENEDRIISEKEILEESKNFSKVKTKRRWSNLFEYNKNGKELKIVRLLKKGENNRVYIFEVYAENFSKVLLNNESAFQNQYGFIIDKNGKVISDYQSPEKDLIMTVRRNFNEGERKDSLNYKNKNYYYVGQTNGLTGWTTITLMDINDLFSESDKLKRSIMLHIIIIVLTVSVIIIIMSFSFTKPIGKLQQGMKEVKNGNFKVRLDTKKKGDLRELIISFNYMVERISQLMLEVSNEKLEAKTAQIRALESQINPHFMYNTLDSINWVLIEHKEIKMSKIIVALGKILRYSVDSSKKYVTLEEELEYVFNYLTIQKYRHGKNLEYEIDISEEFMKNLVPKLILQPLIENAIIHGIEPSEKSCMIVVFAEKIQEDMVISVWNDGEEIAKNELLKIEKLLEGKGGSSIGIYNVNNRLRLLYGKEYGFKLESTKEGITSKIKIPIKKY